MAHIKIKALIRLLLTTAAKSGVGCLLRYGSVSHEGKAVPVLATR